MMTTNVTDRIENILAENKSGVKTYAKYDGAVKAIEAEIADYFGETDGRIEYIVVYIPSTGRFAPVVNFQKFMATPAFKGGFIGYFANRGFMQI